MEISFSQSFLDSLGRIDNKVVIDKFAVDQGTPKTSLHFVCHGNKVQVCVEGISGECSRLDFYYNEGIGFTITGNNIVMNPERTIFEFNFPTEPKAILECPEVTEDTKFLESIGTNYGNSLYKDIPVSDDSLVWKDTLGKYIVDRGLQDNHSYDIELIDTKSGILEERPIKFKSYQNIQIEQGNWDVDMIKKSVVIDHDVYSEISDTSFLVWDSPMIDAKVNLSEEPNCINRIGEYVDPGEVIFGNTDCFQFTNYQSSLVGFKITGTEGSNVEVLFNRKSSTGSFTSFSGIINEDGTIEIRFSDLPYLHFNGIRAVGPSRVTGIETIMYLKETVDEYSPNPDKTYVTRINNTNCYIDINGVCDYIEYEKYLGEVKEIGRGKEHIDSIPGIIIKPIDVGNLVYEVSNLKKQISVKQSSGIGIETYYAVFQVTINNNIEVNGNILTASPLYSDYKIRIEQTGIIWKIYNSPDYINGEDGYGIFLFNKQEGSKRYIDILTNDSRARSSSNFKAVQNEIGQEIFKISISFSQRVIDGDRWGVYTVRIETLSENTENTWRPRMNGTEDPCLITFKFLGSNIPSISLYAIQLRGIDNPVKVWEETIIPGQFTEVDSKITLLNAMTKNFIVTKTGNLGVESLNWYYYDLLGTNQFYITDQSFQTTNVGIEYLISPDTTLLDIGTGDLRSTYGRVINVNRSNIVGSIGTLIVTESSAFPRSWRDLIDNNTENIEVERVLDNIYIQVGPDSENLKNEDYEVELSSISTFSVIVTSNFKYVIQSYGYLKIFPSSEFSDKPSSDLFDRVEEFSKYNDMKTYTFALIKLDEGKEMENSYIEVRSGSVVRRITIKIVGPKREHDYLLKYPNGTIVSKPNIIRIFKNGTIASADKEFLYTSSTTPKIETGGGVKFSEISDSYFNSNKYIYHKSSGTISVLNSRSLSYSKYPMKSFGYIREMSQDYSESEELISTETATYLEYPFYMKGKEHYLWCVDTLGGFSSISDPTDLDTVLNMTLDAKGNGGKTIYVISRYDINNRTFITEYPEETNFKIKRDELEVEITISPQQNIGLDERSQIEYSIPIQVSCNVENNRGNIYLGSLDYKAVTKITEDSLEDVIEVDNNIVELENINKDYIIDNITSDKTQNLSIQIFQLGTEKDVFRLYSSMSDIGIGATSNYIIPEIGSDYTITSFEVTKSVGPRNPVDDSLIGGDDLVTVTSKWDTKYFLIKVDSEERVQNNGNNWYWYSSDNLPYNLIKDTSYNLTLTTFYKMESGITGKIIKLVDFKKFGCNYGLYVNGNVGFGVTDDYSLWGCSTSIRVDNNGGSIKIHAGIFYAVNGIESTEALIVPAEYKFIGENQPIDISWTNGNLDDDGNLCLVLPPRTRDEEGDKEYILQVTQPHDYYPLKLYVIFYQTSLHGPDPDTGKEDYKLMFLNNEIDIWSDGVVVGTESNEYKVNFVHNLSRDAFDNVYFDWGDNNIPGGSIDGNKDYAYLDDLGLEEIERSFDESYVKFRFKPNGSRYFIDTNIVAKMKRTGSTSLELGKVKVLQGYYCLCAEYYNPLSDSESNVRMKNYLSRKSPRELRLQKIGTPPDGYYNMSSNLPCKSNNDNSSASSNFCNSRGVLKLSAYRREYNESSETEYEGVGKGSILGMNDLIKDVELLNISPNTVFESYGISCISVSNSEDHDAKVNPEFNDGKNYATSEIFDEFVPYLEVSYDLKDEYIRNYVTFGISCKVTLSEPDTEKSQEYYFTLTNNSIKSDEPQDISLLKFSDDTLNFDYRGGTKQVSFSPASFAPMFTITRMSGTGWVSFNFLDNSNYISITADENKTTDDDQAFFRTGQIKIEVKDPRNSLVLGSYYINVNQEPDVTKISGG